MRKTLAALVAATAIFTSLQSNADVDLPLAGHSTAISASGGNSAYVVTGNTEPMTCWTYAQYNFGCGYVDPSSCSPGHDFVDFNIGGETCCFDPYSFCAAGTTQTELSVKSNNQESVREVFANDDQRSYYWGYVNSYSRSPSAGRSNAPKAALDACVGHNNVDAYTDGPACRQACTGSQNGYCNDWGSNGGSYVQAAACQDRCDCTFGDASCEGL